VPVPAPAASPDPRRLVAPSLGSERRRSSICRRNTSLVYTGSPNPAPPMRLEGIGLAEMLSQGQTEIWLVLPLIW
jgi:hypothetical protein